MWAMRKICTGKATNLFFNQFCRDILFAFFVFLFLFVCFLESKICILIHTFFCPKVSWHCHQRGPSLAEHSLSILPLTLNLQFDSFGKSMCHQLIWGGQKYISGNILNISKRYQRTETKKKMMLSDGDVAIFQWLETFCSNLNAKKIGFHRLGEAIGSYEGVVISNVLECQ